MQITELKTLLDEVAKVAVLLRKIDITEYTRRADEYLRNSGTGSAVETYLKAGGAAIIMVILVLVMAIVRKINEGVKSHVF